ncbi:MAG: ABC transporter permease [Bacilli bacterium]|nr:ABC transporter permease [Bacilli bacterium]
MIIKNMLSNFKRYRFLMFQLIQRDFKVKYKRSVLGVFWSILQPVLMMTVMAVVFSQMFKFSVPGVNYLVYLMTGIIMFNYFSEATTNAMTSVVYNFTLMNKIYIPKYIFPIAKCLFVGINFLLTLIPWFAIILLSHVGLGEISCPLSIWYILLPYIFVCFFMFTLGIGMIVACISVFLRDMFYIFGILLTIWNYLTPVFYSLEIIPESIRWLFKCNPLYLFLTGVRSIVLFGQRPSLTQMGLMGIEGLACLAIGLLIFKKKQDKFIYYV